MLTFIHGVMGCGKSAQIIEYYETHKNVVCLKPKFDEEFNSVIHSRNGKNVPCINFEDNDDLTILYFNTHGFNKAKTIIVDEVQFCSLKQIEQLNNLSKLTNVICYGLLKNVNDTIIPASGALIYYADNIKELTRQCVCCKEKDAFISGKYVRGAKDCFYKSNYCEILYGRLIPKIISNDTKYLSLCKDCYETKTSFTPKEINTMLKGEM